LKNFRGYSRSFILLSRYIPKLPYKAPVYIKASDFMFYFKFFPIYSNDIQMRNLGDNGDGVS
jgi:hypothetical protein